MTVTVSVSLPFVQKCIFCRYVKTTASCIWTLLKQQVSFDKDPVRRLTYTFNKFTFTSFWP